MSQPTPVEYSPEERQTLLRIAHRAIEAASTGHSFTPEVVSEHLQEPRGAFTTIHLRSNLRGCVGYILPMLPLYLTVADTAASAATRDPRFAPLTPGDAAEVKVEISVLSKPFPITPDEIEPGKHGLLVSDGSRRGVLLPQVAPEHGWDAEQFLTHTCMKARIPADAWRHGARIEAFTAEIFGE
ncbi:MAG: AmmeMemoRadiSam system protein A [Terriglobales bacterium]|jgi:AmmeMemoRadiSam system protein A